MSAYTATARPSKRRAPLPKAEPADDGTEFDPTPSLDELLGPELWNLKPGGAENLLVTIAGTVKAGLEPPTESASRNGGALKVRGRRGPNCFSATDPRTARAAAR